MTEHELLERLREACNAWSPFGDGLVVAVSGGPDSVALLRGLVAIAGQETVVVAAHLNHGLRADWADRDERFVWQLASSLGLRLIAGHVDVEAEARRRPGSLEAVARDCRYNFLRETAESLGARYVALGHTADDQAETILHRVVRGTGLRGLSGMPARRKVGPNCELIRPLLNVARSDVLKFLDVIGQPYCHDATNDDLRHTRNRLRHDLMPRLERDYNPRAREALLRLGRLADEAHQVVDAAAAERLDRADVCRTRGGCSLSTRALLGAQTHVLRAVFVRLWQEMGWGLRDLGFDELDRLARLIQNGTGATTLPGNIDVRRHGQRVEFIRQAGPSLKPKEKAAPQAM